MDRTSALHESISRICAVPIERVRHESELTELGVDSLASAEILTDLEIRLGKQLPVDALRRLTQVRTVGDIEAILRDELIDPSPQPMPDH
jgi:acyl carrier protein